MLRGGKAFGGGVARARRRRACSAPGSVSSCSSTEPPLPSCPPRLKYACCAMLIGVAASAVAANSAMSSFSAVSVYVTLASTEPG